VSWNIQLDHGAHATVTLADKAVNKYMSPIQGYAYDSKTRGLVYSPWKERIIGFAAAIVLVLIILFIKWWTSVRFESNDVFPWFKIVSIEQTTTVVEENETTDEGVDYDF